MKFKMGFEGREDSSVGKVLTTQACQLEFGSAGPMKSWHAVALMAFILVNFCQEMGGGGKEALLKFAGQLSWHTQQQEITRPCFKQDSRQRLTLGGCPLISIYTDRHTHTHTHICTYTNSCFKFGRNNVATVDADPTHSFCKAYSSRHGLIFMHHLNKRGT